MEISASFSRTLLCVKYEEKRFALFCTFYLFLKEFFYTFFGVCHKILTAHANCGYTCNNLSNFTIHIFSVLRYYIKIVFTIGGRGVELRGWRT